MQQTFLVIGFFLLLLIPAIAQNTKPAPVRSQMLVSTDWLAKNLNDSKVVILYIARDRKNYDAGHIPGARFLAYSDIIVTREGVINELPPVEKLQQLFSQLGIGDDSRIILHCDYQGLLSARTYFTLDYLGWGERTALLDGGLEKWQAEKRAVTTTVPEIKPAHFTPHINPKVIVSRENVRDLSWLLANENTAPTLLLDARQPEAYDGSKPREGFPLNGHIPGARNFYWTQNYSTKEIPTLKPIADLRKMYQEAGIEPGKNVVTYCWIGMMASHAYFTLKYLGYDVAMYDGSFTEWVKMDGAKVVTGNQPK